jgi:ZIP family zinc transporter
MGSSSIRDLIGLGAIAGLFPVYLGILVALVVRKIVSRTVEGFLIGLSTGVLIYLFFDLMHEAVELTGARDPLSWVVLLGSLFASFVGVVALEQNQMRSSRPRFYPCPTSSL